MVYAPKNPRRPIAAVDIGTNSIHLTLAQVHPDGRIEIIERIKDQARLGASLGDDRTISPDGIDRAVRTLRRFRVAAARFDAEVRATATATVRAARNRDEFLRRAASEAGVPVEVISGDEEARLTYRGVLNDLPELVSRRVLCIDIGGGSTELLVGKDGVASVVVSADIGSLSITREFFANEPVTPADVALARKAIATKLRPLLRNLREAGFEEAVATSGSVQRIGLVAMALAKPSQRERRGSPRILEPPDVHGFRLDRGLLGEVVAELASAPTQQERLEIRGIDPSRADTLLAGALILESLSDLLQVDHWTLSKAALRTGLIVDTQSRRPVASKDPREDAITALASRFGGISDHAAHVAHLAVELFDATSDLHGYGPEERTLLHAAARMHELGRAISLHDYHRHTAYLIRHGLSEHPLREATLIACIARYHRKAQPKPQHDGYRSLTVADRKRVDLLAGIARVAECLDRGRQALVAGVVANVVDGQRLEIIALPAAATQPQLEIRSARGGSALLASALQRKITLRIQ